MVDRGRRVVGPPGRRVDRRRGLLRALLAAAVLAALLVLPGAPAGAIVLPEADLRVAGTVLEGPDGGGIDTGSTMQYRIQVRNEGPTTIPARGLLLALFVDRADSSELATIEVARFNDGGGLRPAPGGACGNGRRALLQCTNRQALAAGEEITLEIGHRHPAAEAGVLSFVAEVSAAEPTISDPVNGNNSYRGPNYQFRVQPSTTTTSTTSTTVTSTTDSSSTTTDPNASTTTVDSTTSSSTTTSSTSTTTTTTTTTTAPTTTSTTEASTTATETSLEGLSGSATLPGGPTTLAAGTDTSNEQAVLGASGGGPSDGGPPYLLLAAMAALVLLIGGLAVALYAHLNRPPPLVDMRQFDYE